jgi:hypothetical protein
MGTKCIDHIGVLPENGYSMAKTGKTWFCKNTDITEKAMLGFLEGFSQKSMPVLADCRKILTTAIRLYTGRKV